MDELEPPSDETYDKQNVVEFKAANFNWDFIPDPSSLVENTSSKKKERGQHICDSQI